MYLFYYKLTDIFPNQNGHDYVGKELLQKRKVARDQTLLHVDSEGPDQTAQMRRLIWVFARHSNNFVGFPML